MHQKSLSDILYFERNDPIYIIMDSSSFSCIFLPLQVDRLKSFPDWQNSSKLATKWQICLIRFCRLLASFSCANFQKRNEWPKKGKIHLNEKLVQKLVFEERVGLNLIWTSFRLLTQPSAECRSLQTQLLKLLINIQY